MTNIPILCLFCVFLYLTSGWKTPALLVKVEVFQWKPPKYQCLNTVESLFLIYTESHVGCVVLHSSSVGDDTGTQATFNLWLHYQTQ